MILDKETMFADNLDVAGTPTVVDTMFLQKDWGGEPLTLFVSVGANAVDVPGFVIKHGDTPNPDDMVSLYSHQTDMVGQTVQFNLMVHHKRYLGCWLGGTATAGDKWSAGIILPSAELAK